MKALLFPGQGSQLVGMGSDFYKKYDMVKKIFDEADNSLNFKLSKIILEGPKDKLQLTQITQPAIFTVSYAIFSVLKKEFNIDTFKYFAGHSLGEYTALSCSDSLSLKESLYLLNERGKAMQEAVPVGEGSMLAVLGSDISSINILISENIKSGICEIANDNSDGQIILSGEKKTISNFQKILKDKKIKSIPLPVSAPFHCSLMKKAADSLKPKIYNTNFKKPRIEVISNVTAKPESDPNKIKELLVSQIYSKVRWREIILFMKEKGVLEFVEVGPGKVLSGLLKRMINSGSIKNINTVEDLDSFK